MAWEFRLFGVPIRVQLWFAIVAVLLWQLGGDRRFETLPIWAAVMFAGVLAHELGHAFAGRLFGMTPRVELHGMGGVTYWAGGGPLTPLRRMVVSAAGPLVGVVVGLAGLAVWAVVGRTDAWDGLAEYLLRSVVWVNLGWGLLNLIPMVPLDGGHILSSVLELVAPGRGSRWARLFSLVLGAALVAFALLEAQVLMAVLLGLMVWNNYRAYALERRIGPDLAIVGELPALDALVASRELEPAIARAEELLRAAKTRDVRGALLQLAARAHFLRGDHEAARALLASLPAGVPASPLVAGPILHASGEYEAALLALEEAVNAGRGREVEPLLVDSLARLRRFDDAVAIFRSSRGRDLADSSLVTLERAAYEAGAWDQAFRLSETLFERSESPLAAMDAACALARAGDPGRALKWLERARDAGLTDGPLLDREPDLAAVRALPAWPDYRRTLG